MSPDLLRGSFDPAHPVHLRRCNFAWIRSLAQRHAAGSARRYQLTGFPLLSLGNKRATRFNFDMSVWFADIDEGVPPWLVEPTIDLKHLAGLKRLHVRGTYHVDTESVDNSLGHMKNLVQEMNPGLEITTDAQFNPDVRTYQDRMDELNANFLRSGTRDHNGRPIIHLRRP